MKNENVRQTKQVEILKSYDYKQFPIIKKKSTEIEELMTSKSSHKRVNSYVSDKKLILNLGPTNPAMEHHKKINTDINQIFPTIININQKKVKIVNRSPEKRKKTNILNTTENYYKKRLTQIKKTKNFADSPKRKLTKHDIIRVELKDFVNVFEPSLNRLENKMNVISDDISSNPFMRKLDRENKNDFEKNFEKLIKDFVFDYKKLNKPGYFITLNKPVNENVTDKNQIGRLYISEDNNNIFSKSLLAEKINLASVQKFKKHLISNYGDFIDNKPIIIKTKPIIDPVKHEKLIDKFNHELYFEKQIADKFKIKSNPKVKLLVKEGLI